MRILIISCCYSPILNPRAFRWSSISKYWIKQGHNVDVVCAWSPGLSHEEDLDGVRVFRVGRSFINWIRRYFTKPISIQSKIGQRTESSILFNEQNLIHSAIQSTIKQIHDYTWKKIYWPDFAGPWYFPAVRKAKHLLEMNKYDVLITVSHPFTGHVVGYTLKKHLRRIYSDVPWIIDVGDPFCFLDATPTNNHKLYNNLNYSFERKLFKSADIITVTTETTLNKYADLFPESASKIYVVPPLFSPPEIISAHGSLFEPKNMIRLVYLGTLYRGIRNPTFLLRLYEHLLRTDLSDTLELHFFGQVNDCKDIFKPLQTFLGGKIFLHGLVDHTTTYQAMKEADFLINIGNATPYQLPSKVVEYASMGKPIINIIKILTDSSVNFLKSYPATFTILDDEQNLKNDRIISLKQFIENPPKIEDLMLKRWLRYFQTDSIASEYEELLRNY